MKIVRLLANLGYGSRKEVERMLKAERVANLEGETLGAKSSASHEEVLVDGERLDPPAPMILMMNKPIGFTCSNDEREGDLIYDLLPERFTQRKPALSSVGRLDKDTSGLLLLSDDGQFLHRMIHPKHRVEKTYHVFLDREITGEEEAVFSSGELLLNNEKAPCLPAKLEVINAKEVRLTIVEGRYHQVRRMFAAVGNHVLELSRSHFGELQLGDLPEGEWRYLTEEEIAAVRK